MNQENPCGYSISVYLDLIDLIKLIEFIIRFIQNVGNCFETTFGGAKCEFEALTEPIRRWGLDWF